MSARRLPAGPSLEPLSLFKADKRPPSHARMNITSGTDERDHVQSQAQLLASMQHSQSPTPSLSFSNAQSLYLQGVQHHQLQEPFLEPQRKRLHEVMAAPNVTAIMYGLGLSALSPGYESNQTSGLSASSNTNVSSPNQASLVQSHADGPEDADEDGSEENAENEEDQKKQHFCSHCGKGFNRPSSLRIHLNTHTGEKPFVCPFPGCGRSFNVSSNMRRHYRNHVRRYEESGPVSVPNVEVAAQENIFIFGDQQRFQQAYSAGYNTISCNSSSVQLQQSQIFTTSVNVAESFSGRTYELAPFGTENTHLTGFERFSNLQEAQSSFVQQPQAQASAFPYDLQANAPGVSLSQHQSLSTAYGSVVVEQTPPIRIHPPSLQVQIPVPSVPKINIPSYEPNAIPFDPQFSSSPSPYPPDSALPSPAVSLGPSLSSCRSRSVSRERTEYEAMPNISRPASSLSVPSPPTSSASPRGRFQYSSMAQNGSSSSLLPPNPYATFGSDATPALHYTASHAQCSSPQPSVSMGYPQRSPSMNGSPHPPLTPITPSYSPCPSSSHLPLSQQYVYSLPEAQLSYQSLSSAHSNGSFVSLQAPAIASSEQLSPMPEQFRDSGFAEVESMSKVGPEGHVVGPHPPPANANSHAISPNLADFPSAPPPAPLPEALSLAEAKDSVMSTLLPHALDSSSSTPTPNPMPVRKVKIPSGRPRGRPKGSKNKPKIFDANGNRIYAKPASKGKTMICGTGRRQTLSQVPATSNEVVDFNNYVVKSTQLSRDEYEHVSSATEDSFDVDADGDEDDETNDDEYVLGPLPQNHTAQVTFEGPRKRARQGGILS